jgi:hypothetical protein
LHLWQLRGTLIVVNHRSARNSEEPQMSRLSEPAITIRPAYADDDHALVRLAALDSATVMPARPLLVAEIDDEIRAALSQSDGTVIADPFHRTRELVDLLRVHASARPRTTGRRQRASLRRLRIQHGY